jgi:trehalose/maltose hydrolase-like predicted phosphorylase
MFSRVPLFLSVIPEKKKNEIFSKINLEETELKKWEEISNQLTLIVSENGIISQYDGYFELEELDWDYFRKKYGNVYRMDRLLKAEGKSADDFKVAKQADTLMTFYNLDKDAVDTILKKLGYNLPQNYLESNLNYYLQRTSHGSTLSRVVHTKLANLVGDKKLGWELYSDALTSDFNDIQGGTTGEGIHAGAMAGTVMLAINLFAGINLNGQTVNINPDLPLTWKSIGLNFTFKGINHSVNINRNLLSISADQDSIIEVLGVRHNLISGQVKQIKLLKH